MVENWVGLFWVRVVKGEENSRGESGAKRHLFVISCEPLCMDHFSQHINCPPYHFSKKQDY
jgi:hypothetical protein